MIRATLEIINRKGLHARAAAKFVKTVECCDAQIKVAKMGDETEVAGSSILGLMMLGAEMGSKLLITAEGQEAEKVMLALRQLLAGKFGEPE